MVGVGFALLAVVLWVSAGFGLFKVFKARQS